MTNSNEYIDGLCEEISEIMAKYPNIFPLVEVLKERNDDLNYIRLMLQLNCGLRAIVKAKNSAFVEMHWTIPIGLYPLLRKSLIVNVLLEYALNWNKIENEWQEMLKNEQL